jgi:hypothetical protein
LAIYYKTKTVTRNKKNAAKAPTPSFYINSKIQAIIAQAHATG